MFFYDIIVVGPCVYGKALLPTYYMGSGLELQVKKHFHQMYTWHLSGILVALSQT